MATSPTQMASTGWTGQDARLAGLALVAGCLLPLWKQSLVFDSSVLVWPWQLTGLAAGVETRAALATPADGENFALWAVLPLLAGVVAFRIARTPSLRTRGLASVACGTAMLGLLLVVLVPENAVLGLAFVPPTCGAGALMLAGLAAGAFLAAANHAAKSRAAVEASRGFVAAAAAVLIAEGLFFLLGAGGVWAARPLTSVYVLVVAYGLLAIRQISRGGNAAHLAAWSSTLVRIIVVWSPIAVVLAQRGSADGFVTFVVEARGSAVQTALAALKAFLIFAGGGLLLASGFAAILEARRAP